MTEKQPSARKHVDVSAKQSCEEDRNNSAEEARVWAAFKQARQNVKPIVKKERQAEIASAELLNLRLKAKAIS